MPSYHPAPPEVLAALSSLASEHYPDLARVRFEVLMAHSSSDLPAAESRPTSPLHRAAGLADVLVVLDAERYEAANEAGRAAMLDHALAGLSPVLSGNVLATDGAGRPKLRCRRPDLIGLGYRAVWERHKSSSVEASSARALKDRAGQLLMFD